MGTDRPGGNKSAHRLSFETFIGPVPEGLNVCHHCDNRLCIKPSHLFLGTHLDNSLDMVTKGRSPRGVRCGRSKLTEQQVYIIRSSTAPTRTLADTYGVSMSLVRQVRTGKIWKHLTTQ